jgi:DNA-binding NtrC family response regulator
MEALVNADWPGNIRELENFIERCVILTQGEELNVPSAELRRSAASAASTFEQAERQVIIQALKSRVGENSRPRWSHRAEIDKASDALWQLLLRMLDKAILTLGTTGESICRRR